MKHYLQLFAVGLLSVVLFATFESCSADKLASTPSANKDVTVDVLTTFDGITVYRVHDGDDRIVYIAATGGAYAAQWSENCGKGCVRHVETTTVKR